jgi:hypothetical protein
MLTAEQFAAAQRANVETLFGLTNKAFKSPGPRWAKPRKPPAPPCP